MDQPFNTLDIAILAVVGFSAIIGLFRGFVREVLSLAAWAGAAWVALTFHERAKVLLRPYIHDPHWNSIVAGAGLFIVTLVVLMLIAGFLSRGVKRTSVLGPADRIMGLVFGVMRGAVVVALTYIVTVNMLGMYELQGDESTHQPVWVETSRLLPHVRDVASLLEKMVPEELALIYRKKRQDSPGQSGGTSRHSGPDTPRENGYTPGQRQQVPKLLERQPPE